MLPVLPSLPVHITQNIAPKLGQAIGSTGTVGGYQFPKIKIFKPLSFQKCPLRLSSKPPEIVYMSVDRARFKNRFPCVPERFPDSTVPILPFSPTKQIVSLPNRKFSVKTTQIPLAPGYLTQRTSFKEKRAKQ